METGEDAVVIGAGIAGLLAARVLSGRFGRVTLVERDPLPAKPAYRKGIPQSRHQHIFLPRGRQIAERLFPGFENDLVSAGAEPLDLGQSGHWFTPAGLAPRFHAGLALLGCTRDLAEWAIRERVTALPNVRFRECTTVARLLPAHGERVAGVALRPHGRNEADSEESLRADLVVDAGGRNSKAPQWLRALGYAPPAEIAINAHPGYATRLYERPDDAGHDWQFVLVQTAPPDHNRGGVLSPVEGGRWMCSLVGLGDDQPPTSEEGFVAFARSLRSPVLYEAIRDARPISPIHGYREIENRRRRYDQLPRQPHNFLVTGDAACSFNPIYGQGMTTAALGAEILGNCLDERRGSNRPGLARRFQRMLAKANAVPWLLATGEDLRVRGVEGGPLGRSARLAHRYFDRVLALSLRDLAVRRTLLEVFGMLRPPTALFAPAIAAKVAREALVGRGDAGQVAARGQLEAEG
jgi:2-polyprenyl-6-methoxyphenol hydroxylase-like FAD-dependent oxidoreductase